MTDFDPGFVRDLAVESWIEFAFGIITILLRIYARARKESVRGLNTGDWLMFGALIAYTILVVCLNIIAAGGGSNLYEPEYFESFSTKEIEARVFGSKIVVASEQAMLLTIYLVKGSILFMYSKMTTILPTTEHLKYLGGYIVAGFIATEGTFFTACRPFRGYWAMPPPDPQCTTLENYAIVQAVFNISSDIMMLCWVLPILWSTKLAAPQKSVCLGLFGLGIFVIIAALLTKVFNLTDVYSPNYMRWYTRESSVAIYMSNMPWIWPELKRWIPCLQRMFPDIQGVGYDSLGRTSSSRRTSCGPERYSQSLMLENIRGSPTVVQGGISLAVQHRIRAHREIENELLRRTPSETELDQALHTRNYSTETGDNLEVQPNSIKKRTTVRIEISDRDVIEPDVERGLGNSAQDTTLDSETEVASTISNGKYTEIGASSPVNDKRVGKQDSAPHPDEISNSEKDDKPAKQDKGTEPTKI